MSIHYARVEKSPRLQRALTALQAAGERGLTTREWQFLSENCNAHTDAAELRKNGYTVDCKPDGRTPSGSTVYRYKLGQV